jgi:cbb3-type cytochrome oxidase maturation protein
MNIIFVLIPLGIVLVALALWAFFWAVGDGQFDDLESPGWAVLTDERQPADGRLSARRRSEIAGTATPAGPESPR